MFKLEDAVYINKLNIKGIIKESKDGLFKVTYFDGDKRMFDYFKEDELSVWKVNKKKFDKIYFAKLRPDAIIPTKLNENAGYDFYANFEGDEFIIHPFKPTLIPTGVAWASTPKYDLNFKNERSSVGTKGLVALCGLVDSGFRNEIFFCVVNINNKPFVISKNVTEFIKGEDFDLYPASKAIAQGKVEFVPKVQVVEVTYDELLNIKSQRGLGMLGSSGK